MVCKEQVSVSVKSPVPLTTPICNGAVPVLVTVTVCPWLAVPTGKLPKESKEGDVAMPGSVPCPLAVASVEASPFASLITSDPERFPVDVGEKLKLMEHLAPVCKTPAHWSDSMKLFDTVIGLSVKATVPVFVTVSVCASLVVPAI
jgi:hypothetical protein